MKQKRKSETPMQLHARLLAQARAVQAAEQRRIDQLFDEIVRNF